MFGYRDIPITKREMNQSTHPPHPPILMRLGSEAELFFLEENNSFLDNLRARTARS